MDGTKPLRAALLVTALLLLPAVLDAEEPQAKTGTAPENAPWVLDCNNWQLGHDLVPEPVLRRIKDCEYRFKIVPVDPARFRRNYSDRYWAQSQANEGKFDLDPETCGLKDTATGKIATWFFGYPFPKIDPDDPQAGCKIAWNFRAANMQGEGQGATFTLNGIEKSGEFRRIKALIHVMNFLGLHRGPIPNPDNLQTKAITRALEPQDVEGVSTLTVRHNDWKGQDSIWAYVPSVRRARRVNAATRSDPVAGLDIFADDLNCYAGKVEYYRWKLVGEGKTLAPVLQPYPLPQKQIGPTRFEVTIPYMNAVYETPGAKGAPWLIVDNLVYVVRPVWIVEGQSTDPYYNFGKVIMYFDKDLYRIYWKLVHNRAGEYFYNAACGYHWSKSDDGHFTAVTPNVVIGVNDKTNRAALGGRYQSQFIERNFNPTYFSLRTLARLSD